MNEIRCKRVIEGKSYNTETSALLGRVEDAPVFEALFKTRSGTYFLFVEIETEPSEEIEAMTPEEAQAWMEKHCDGEAVEAEFGEMPEAGSTEARITLRLPETLHRRIAGIADERGQSLNSWIQRCIERCLGSMEAMK